MYGLILENIASFIRTHYGAKTWQEIQYVAGVEYENFNIYDIYSEGLVHKVSPKTIKRIRRKVLLYCSDRVGHPRCNGGTAGPDDGADRRKFLRVYIQIRLP